MSFEFDTEDTEKVAKELRAIGFVVTPVTGNAASQNPDLLVAGEPTFWAEVKTLDQSPEVRGFDHALDYLRQRLVDLPCAVDLYIDERARDRDYKMLHRLVRRALRRNRLPAFALLADGYDPKLGYNYDVEFEGENGRVSILAYLNQKRELVAPWVLDFPKFAQRIDLVTDNENDTNASSANLRLGAYSDEFFIGARLFQRAQYAGLLGTMRAKGAWLSTDAKRLRRDVQKANRQIAAACRRKSLPGVVFLVGRASRQTFVSTLLGDLTVSFPVKGESDAKQFYGRNGVFRPNQNRHVSAAYLLNGKDRYFLANPFAHHSLSNVLSSAHQITIDAGGNGLLPD